MNKLVIILGLPRSGTSFLTSLVSAMGYNPGPRGLLKKADKNNKYGYYENLIMQYFSKYLLWRMGADIFYSIPSGYDVKKFYVERIVIRSIVSLFNIEVLKDNNIVVLGRLYKYFFPEAKFIFIRRDARSTYKSRFGGEISFSEWKAITEARINAWYAAEPSDEALEISYEQFLTDKDKSIDKIANYLGVALSQNIAEKCRALFMPRAAQ